MSYLPYLVQSAVCCLGVGDTETSQTSLSEASPSARGDVPEKVAGIHISC